MLFDVQVGFSVIREKKVGGEVLSFMCNHCEDVVLVSMFNFAQLLHCDTYSGIQGYLQLHLMECKKYKESLYKEKKTTIDSG